MLVVPFRSSRNRGRPASSRPRPALPTRAAASRRSSVRPPGASLPSREPSRIGGRNYRTCRQSSRGRGACACACAVGGLGQPVSARGWATGAPADEAAWRRRTAAGGARRPAAAPRRNSTSCPAGSSRVVKARQGSPRSNATWRCSPRSWAAREARGQARAGEPVGVRLDDGRREGVPLAPHAGRSSDRLWVLGPATANRYPSAIRQVLDARQWENAAPHHIIEHDAYSGSPSGNGKQASPPEIFGFGGTPIILQWLEVDLQRRDRWLCRARRV